MVAAGGTGRWAIEHRYDAFISYNHAADDDLAPAVERGLEQLAKPWYRLRAISVFRDVSDTGLNPSLWGTVQRQLDGSRWFVLLVCPESAASQWVRREVDHWSDTKGVDTILLVLTGGELVWDRERGRFGEATTALAPEVAARFTTEPLHLDLRWTDGLGRPPTLRDPRFRSEMARLASPIRDLPPDEIESEDVRLHRKARRLARGAVAMLVTLAIVASIAAVVAVRNANEAERRARQAVARQVGLAALDMPASDLDEALLVSVAAARLDPVDDADRFLATRTLLGRHSRLVALLQTPPELGEPSVRGVAISPSGEHVAGTVWPTSGDPQLVRWTLPGGDAPTTAPWPPAATGFVTIGEDGTVMAPTPGTTIALSDDGAVAVERAGAHVRVVDTTTDPGSPPIAEWVGDTAVAAIFGDRVAVAVDRDLHVVDARDGTELVAPTTLARDVAAVALRGDTVVVASDGRLTWWTLTGGELEPTRSSVAVDVGTITQVAIDGAGRRVLVGGDLGTAVVGPGGVVTTDDATGFVSPDPSGRFAAVVGTHLTVWSMARAQPVVSVPEPMNAVAWSDCDGTATCRLVSAGATIDVWEPGAGRRVRLADQSNAQTVDISADGATVVTAGWGPSVAVWSLALPIDDRGREQLADTGSLSAVDVTTGTLATVDAADAAVVVVSRPDRADVEVETGFDAGPIDGVALAGGGARLVTASGGEVRVHDVATGQEVGLDLRCRRGVWAISPNGRWLAAHDPATRQTALCDLTTDAPAVGFGLDAEAAVTESLAVDDDGSIALAGGGLVEYHPLVGGAFARQAEAVSIGYADERVAIPVVAVRAGRVAAAVARSDEGLARVLVWDARRRGTPIQFETDHTEVVAVALLGTSAELLAVAGRFGDGDPVVQVWEAESRRQLGRGLGGLGRDVRALTGDASVVVGTDGDGRTFQWPLDLDPRRTVCDIVGRDLNPTEWLTVADGALGRYRHKLVCDD